MFPFVSFDHFDYFMAEKNPFEVSFNFQAQGSEAQYGV